jgi:hypothetical protein
LQKTWKSSVEKASRAMAKFDRQHGVPGLREAQSDRLPASLYALLMRPEFCGIAALQ